MFQTLSLSIALTLSYHVQTHHSPRGTLVFRLMCTSERTSRSGSAGKLQDIKVVLHSPQRKIDPSATTANAGNERKLIIHIACTSTMTISTRRLLFLKKLQCVTTPLWPNVLKSPMSGKVALATAAAGERRSARASRNTNNGRRRRVAELKDLADSRPSQSAELWNVRGGTSLLPRRLAASCSLFDMLPVVVLDPRTGWSLNEPAGRAKCWTTLDVRQPIFVIGSLPQFTKSAFERLNSGELKWLERGGLANLIFCVTVPLAVWE